MDVCKPLQSVYELILVMHSSSSVVVVVVMVALICTVIVFEFIYEIIITLRCRAIGASFAFASDIRFAV